ncbi:MAG TPA: hypothetical protein VGB45_13510 [Abditibacterium sp.]|jgi:hypothetical protein
MPATALRHPETAEETVLPVVSPSQKPSPDSSTDPNLEWRTVAPYVDRFTGAQPTLDRAALRRRARRHKPFLLSGAFLAGTLVLIELMGLVWIYALDLKTLRQVDKLDREIAQVQLKKAQTLNKLASYKSSPQLAQWAAQLGYRPIGSSDFDDVTSNAPLPPVPAKKETP